MEGEVNVAVDAVAVGFNLLGESRLADGSAANINEMVLSNVSDPDPGPKLDPDPGRPKWSPKSQQSE
jgi:hypothetical protein